MDDSTEIMLGTVDVRDGVELRVSTKKYKGKAYLSARIWEKYQASGEMGPTKKGFTVAADLATDVAALIAKAG